ncbi:S66 peptidase family protein [Amphibacillus sp. Q70]|uniref:S66 peptidase family protein n=1 Tax=Amphibacillus sp. Q70 TaxID=3453416 RepID=UPI003F85F635
MLGKGDQIGLIACSDGRSLDQVEKIKAVKQVFASWGLKAKEAQTIYQQEGCFWSGKPEKRARELMKLYLNPEIKAIFDLSGGDSANQVLPYLDFEKIEQCSKPFLGYSDLTVVLNSLFSQANHPSYHYQIIHLVGEDYLKQQEQLYRVLFDQAPPISFDYYWLYGKEMSGTMIGGNIRCLLKLAGTNYLPNPSGKILFLESRSGLANRIATFFAQLDQIGYFEKISGILLGEFSELEQKEGLVSLIELIHPYQERYQFPVAKTDQVGHSVDSHILRLGVPYKFTAQGILPQR